MVIEESLAEMKISNSVKQKTSTLSNIEYRSIKTVGTLISKPRFLLMEEPFNSINPINIIILLKIVISLKEKILVFSLLIMM
jgi:ABC-type lipopolysaccharide export system ATPase subunit